MKKSEISANNNNEIYSSAEKGYKGNPTIPIFVLLIVALTGILLFVMFFYKNQKASLTEKIQNDINTITDLKTTQIQGWRKERFDDGEMISSNRMLSDKIRLYHDNNTEEVKNDILYWLKTLTRNSNYKSARLVDETGNIILSIPNDSKKPGKNAIINIEKVVNEKQVLLSDFHFYEATDTVHLDLVIPIITNYDSDVKELLLLEIDPYDYLYPMIQTWPTASETAECLLIKKDGNDALYLNELKNRKNSALKYRITGDNVNVLAIKAINGVRGITEGVDYQNKQVIGVIKPVVGTDWIMISKMEKGELYSGIDQVTTFTVILISLFLIIVGSIILYIWNRQKASHYRSLYIAEVKREALKMHFEYVVKYANDVMVLTDKKGKFLEANDRALSVYGYTKEELLKLYIKNFRPPESQDEIQSIFKTLHEKGGMLYETIHVKKDGTKFPVEISSREIIIDGNPFFQGIIRDISERKKAEEKITNLNRIYAILSQVNQAIVWTKEREKLFDRICEVCVKYGKFLFAWIGVTDEKNHRIIPVAFSGHSDGYLEIIKISDLDEPGGNGPTGRSIREGKYIICDDIENDPTMAPWKEYCLKRGYRSSASFPIKCAGKIIGNLNLYSGSIDFFKQEEVVLFEEVIYDISYALDNFEKELQKRKAIDSLLISEKRFKTVFENANDAIMLMDEDKIIDFNKKTEELFGFNRNELLNKSSLDLSPELQKDNRNTKEKFDSLANETYGGKPMEYEWLYKKAAGDLFDAEVSLNAIHLGSKVLLSAIIRDITAKKKTEEDMRIAKEKAEEMNRLKSTFLANMSHELRTPMTGILGFADILYDELTDKGYKEMAGIILNGGKRLTSTLNSILDLSRVEADKMDLKLENINISKVVKDSVQLFDASAKEKGLFLHGDIEEDIYLEVDRRIFDHIITNLIQNAVVYTEKGDITVKLNRENVNAVENIILKITDTGIGIPDNLQDAIFEPFRQVSDGLARKFEGTGLGLTLTKKFVEILNGEIKVQSKLGAGSTFTVRLPLKYNSAKESNTQEPNSTKNLNPHKYMDKKILLVEDDSDTILTIQVILKNLCEMETVTNGYEAIEKTKKNKYDVILMDIGLKGMSGLDAAQEIKKLPGYKDTPIVAVTAYAMVGDKEKFLEGGCTHYISKPFDINEFKNTVAGLL
jgi:PAS domain S-box-containing protein